MFVKYQNNSFDILSKLLSPDVKITDTGRINSKDFAALLSYLISKDENKIYGFEPTGVSSICSMRQTGETFLSGKVNLFENDSASLFTGEDEMLDAELILQSDSEKNISIPVTIIFGENYINTESDKTVLVLFIDTNALDYTEKENLNYIFNQQVVINTDVSDKLDKVGCEFGLSNEGNAAVNTGKTNGNKDFDLKSYEGVNIVNDSDTRADDIPSVVLKNVNILEKTPLIYTDLSQPLQFDAAPVVPDMTNSSDNFDDIDSKKLITIEHDFSQENLSKTQNSTKSNENYIVSRISIEKFVTETTGKDTDLPQFVLYTSSDETPLVVKPLETVSSGTSLIKLLHKYSSSGEHIEIAVVVKSDIPAKSESELAPATNILNNNIENNFKVDSETLEYLRYARINNQYVVTSDINTAGDVAGSSGDEPAQIFTSPEMAGRESDAVKEFGSRIINNLDKNVENMSHKMGADTGIESSRDILPSQFPQGLERAEGFPDHRVTFYENEMEYTGQNHDVSVTSDSAETMIKDKPIIENSPSSGMIRESFTANPADSENISVEVKNVPDNNVDSNDNSFHIYKENVEGARVGKTVTAQHIPDKSVSEAEVIHESEKTVETFKSNPEIRTPDRVSNSEKNIEVNVTSKDNLQVVNVSENNKAEEIAPDMNGNLPQSSDEKQGIIHNKGGTEHISSESDSPDSGNLSLNNIDTHTQNEFQENPEFLNDRESTQKQLTNIEKLPVDDKPEVITDSKEHYFGLQGTSENKGESISGSELVTYSGRRTYKEVDEKQILKSIVRQARFMNQRGHSSAVIKLEPPNLGRLQLDIITNHSRITGRIVVESQEIKELIQNNISQLCESLAQNGLKVDSFDVQVGHNDGGNNWARMEVFKNFADTKRRATFFANNSTVTAEEQTIVSKTGSNKSMYSEIFDVWI